VVLTHFVSVFRACIRTNSDVCYITPLSDWFCVSELETVYSAIRTESCETGALRIYKVN
jgi:hypothetical protein